MCIHIEILSLFLSTKKKRDITLHSWFKAQNLEIRIAICSIINYTYLMSAVFCTNSAIIQVVQTVCND